LFIRFVALCLLFVFLLFMNVRTLIFILLLRVHPSVGLCVRLLFVFLLIPVYSVYLYALYSYLYFHYYIYRVFLGGTSIVLEGENFGTGTPVVRVGSSQCIVTQSNHTHITCTTPEGEVWIFILCGLFLYYYYCFLKDDIFLPYVILTCCFISSNLTFCLILSLSIGDS